MGQSIVVTEKPSSNRGVVRFETNRALTGMGHERYVAGTEVWGNRPPDELARRLLAHGSVAGVGINGNVITVDLEKGFDSTGLKEIVENLYRFYPDVDPAAASSSEPEPEPPAAAAAEPEPAPAAAVPEPVAAVAPEATTESEAVTEADPA